MGLPPEFAAQMLSRSMKMRSESAQRRREVRDALPHNQRKKKLLEWAKSVNQSSHGNDDSVADEVRRDLAKERQQQTLATIQSEHEAEMLSEGSSSNHEEASERKKGLLAASLVAWAKTVNDNHRPELEDTDGSDNSRDEDDDPEKTIKSSSENGENANGHGMGGYEGVDESLLEDILTPDEPMPDPDMIEETDSLSAGNLFEDPEALSVMMEEDEEDESDEDTDTRSFVEEQHEALDKSQQAEVKPASNDESKPEPNVETESSHHEVDEEDEEVRIAMEMALAAAQNPGMKPDQLRKLVESKHNKESQDEPQPVVSKRSSWGWGIGGFSSSNHSASVSGSFRDGTENSTKDEPIKEVPAAKPASKGFFSSMWGSSNTTKKDSTSSLKKPEEPSAETNEQGAAAAPPAKEQSSHTEPIADEVSKMAVASVEASDDVASKEASVASDSESTEEFEDTEMPLNDEPIKVDGVDGSLLEDILTPDGPIPEPDEIEETDSISAGGLFDDPDALSEVQEEDEEESESDDSHTETKSFVDEDDENAAKDDVPPTEDKEPQDYDEYQANEDETDLEQKPSSSTAAESHVTDEAEEGNEADSTIVVNKTSEEDPPKTVPSASSQVEKSTLAEGSERSDEHSLMNAILEADGTMPEPSTANAEETDSLSASGLFEDPQLLSDIEGEPATPVRRGGGGMDDEDGSGTSDHIAVESEAVSLISTLSVDFDDGNSSRGYEEGHDSVTMSTMDNRYSSAGDDSSFVEDDLRVHEIDEAHGSVPRIYASEVSESNDDPSSIGTESPDKSKKESLAKSLIAWARSVNTTDDADRDGSESLPNTTSNKEAKNMLLASSLLSWARSINQSIGHIDNSQEHFMEKENDEAPQTNDADDESSETSDSQPEEGLGKIPSLRDLYADMSEIQEEDEEDVFHELSDSPAGKQRRMVSNIDATFALDTNDPTSTNGEDAEWMDFSEEADAWGRDITESQDHDSSSNGNIEANDENQDSDTLAASFDAWATTIAKSEASQKKHETSTMSPAKKKMLAASLVAWAKSVNGEDDADLFDVESLAKGAPNEASSNSSSSEVLNNDKGRDARRSKLAFALASWAKSIGRMPRDGIRSIDSFNSPKRSERETERVHRSRAEAIAAWAHSINKMNLKPTSQKQASFSNRAPASDKFLRSTALRNWAKSIKDSQSQLLELPSLDYTPNVAGSRDASYSVKSRTRSSALLAWARSVSADKPYELKQNGVGNNLSSSVHSDDFEEWGFQVKRTNSTLQAALITWARAINRLNQSPDKQNQSLKISPEADEDVFSSVAQRRRDIIASARMNGDSHLGRKSGHPDEGETAPAIVKPSIDRDGSDKSVGSHSTAPVDNKSEHPPKNSTVDDESEMSEDADGETSDPTQLPVAALAAIEAVESAQSPTTLNPTSLRNTQPYGKDDDDRQGGVNPLSCLVVLGGANLRRKNRKAGYQRDLSPSSDDAIVSESGMSQQERNSNSAPTRRPQRRRMFGWLMRRNDRKAVRGRQRKRDTDQSATGVPDIAEVGIAANISPERGPKSEPLSPVSPLEVPPELVKLVQLLTDNPSTEVTSASSREALQSLENFEREAELQKERHEKEIGELRNNLRNTLRTATQLKNLNRGYGMAQKELSEELLQTQTALAQVRHENDSLKQLSEDLANSKKELQSLREENHSLLHGTENGTDQNEISIQKLNQENEVLRKQLIQLSKAEQEITQMRAERDSYMKRVEKLEEEASSQPKFVEDPEKAKAVEKLESEKKSLLSQIFDLKELVKSREQQVREKDERIQASLRSSTNEMVLVKEQRDLAKRKLRQLEEEKQAELKRIESESQSHIASLEVELTSSKATLASKMRELDQLKADLTKRSLSETPSRPTESRDVSATRRESPAHNPNTRNAANDDVDTEKIEELEETLKEKQKKIKHLKLKLARAQSALKKRNKQSDRPVHHVIYPGQGGVRPEDDDLYSGKGPLKIGQLLQV